HARGHAGAAVGDEIAFGEVRERRVPWRVERAGNPARHLVDWIRLAAPPFGHAGIDDDQLAETCRQLVDADDVVVTRTRCELGRLDLLVAGSERPVPGV